MNVLIQPDDGMSPLLKAIRQAKQGIQIVIFRFDLAPLEDTLAAAVARGVPVRALIANTNRGGEKRLRKLEQRLLDSGITIARTSDEFVRYHGKMLIVDDALFVLGFNYTSLDIERSRGFGLHIRDARLLKAANDLFDSDATRQPFAPSDNRLVVSPENARDVLAEFITGARKSLAIYDMNLSDPRMLKLLEQRLKAGVEVRVIGGKVKKPPEQMSVRKLSKLRLHARTIVRDGTRVFIGSQSLRKTELDQRREVGIIATDSRIAKRVLQVFEADWESAKLKQEPEPTEEKAPASQQASGAK